MLSKGLHLLRSVVYIVCTSPRQPEKPGEWWVKISSEISASRSMADSQEIGGHAEV